MYRDIIWIGLFRINIEIKLNCKKNVEVNCVIYVYLCLSWCYLSIEIRNLIVLIDFKWFS